MINAILGQKLGTIQKFDEKDFRQPVTKVKVKPCFVVQIRTEDKDGYTAIQLGWGEKDLDKVSKPIQGHLKGAKLKKAPLFFREIRMNDVSGIKVGDEVKASVAFKVGDEVKVTGTAKGKGFTGVMKRWGFHGGPRTHGQSDRERAPGSIGQGTTPGRVFKGKKMPGRSGGQKVTVSGLTIFGISKKDNFLEVKGLLPGHKGSFLVIRKEDAKN